MFKSLRERLAAWREKAEAEVKEEAKSPETASQTSAATSDPGVRNCQRGCLTSGPR